MTGDNRDLWIYLLREPRGLANEAIGFCFGLTYASVSRRIGETQKHLKVEKEWINTLASLKSQIKV